MKETLCGLPCPKCGLPLYTDGDCMADLKKGKNACEKFYCKNCGTSCEIHVIVGEKEEKESPATAPISETIWDLFPEECTSLKKMNTEEEALQEIAEVFVKKIHKLTSENLYRQNNWWADFYKKHDIRRLNLIEKFHGGKIVANFELGKAWVAGTYPEGDKKLAEEKRNG